MFDVFTLTPNCEKVWLVTDLATCWGVGSWESGVGSRQN
ncbi:hypothetical protein AVDCRST_MAG94-5641 [uncultured Leptolyngbya sp.]|uniref:Uncharacterized protein n=1 Tax=uncultured Leptolyngbya sp. TaxID=332963 RepID=A0A6J4NSP3_9CYAN|nr:hypothetical protein AVDCRST_MAG94-5641 [uncultured Leptolyngbya sp.]